MTEISRPEGSLFLLTVLLYRPVSAAIFSSCGTQTGRQTREVTRRNSGSCRLNREERGSVNSGALSLRTSASVTITNLKLTVTGHFKIGPPVQFNVIQCNSFTINSTFTMFIMFSFCCHTKQQIYNILRFV